MAQYMQLIDNYRKISQTFGTLQSLIMYYLNKSESFRLHVTGIFWT